MNIEGKIRVAHFVHWPKSGITSLLKSLIPTLRGVGVDSEVLFFVNDSDEQLEFERIGGYAVLPQVRSLATRFRYAKSWFSGSNVDLIHAHSISPLVWAVLLGKYRSRIVVTLHSRYPYLVSSDFRSKIKRKVYEWAVCRGDAVLVCVSAVVAEAAMIAFPNVRKITVIDNGLPDYDTKYSSRENDDAPEDEMRTANDGDSYVSFVSLGRLNTQKGYVNLLEAFSRVVRVDPRAKLSIAGQGELYNLLQSILDSRNINDSAALVGQANDPIKFLRTADFYVMSSIYEGCPITLLEAMREGIPIVTTPCGADALGLEHGVHAIVARDSSVEGIADVLLEALSGRYERAALIHEARKLFRSNFTIEKTASRYEELYRQLLKPATNV